MLFNSWAFILVFLPVTLLVAHMLRGVALLRWICVCSLVFYGFAGHAWFVIPMLITTCLDYYIGQAIEAAGTLRARKRLLVLSLACNLGLLAYFKYAVLLGTTAASLWVGLNLGRQTPEWIRALTGIVLPAGISFYTFQTISYVVDVYRGHCRAERNFFVFAGFVSFYPHLVAGPLTRHHQLIPQLRELSRTGVRARWVGGLTLFAIGLSKKVLLADQLGEFIDPILDRGLEMQLFTAWACMLGYAFQIYFDFSGYSDMAIGLGRLFGIELPQNFNSPYQATDPSDFWKRWHITLSTWLRDYLYIPLGGSRCSRTRRNANLMITMVLGGLWHGAAWTFAAWGLLHGSYLIAYHSVQRYFDPLPRWLRIGITFTLVAIAWIPFRAHGFGQAVSWFQGVLGLNGVEAAAPIPALTVAETYFVIMMLMVASFIAFARPNASSDAQIGHRIGHQVLVGTSLAIALLLMESSEKFLYFQF